MSKRDRWRNLAKQLCTTSGSDKITLQLNLVHGAGFQCSRTASVQPDTTIKDGDETFTTPNEWYNRFRKINAKDNGYDRVTVNGCTLKKLWRELCVQGRRLSQRMPRKRRVSNEKSSPINTTRRGKYVRLRQKKPLTTKKQMSLPFKPRAEPLTTSAETPRAETLIQCSTFSVASASASTHSVKQLRLDYRWLKVQDVMVCTFGQTALEWIQENAVCSTL